MKILWVKSDFLHPTNYGGQIRTLEIVKRLHRDHEVHYMAYDHPRHPDALGRAGEYSTRSYPVKLEVPPMGSAAFAGQLLVNLFSDQPLSVSRYRSAAMQGEIARLLERVQFDSIVCDFLFPAPNFPALDRCVLFQHNVEQMIWKRHTENARLLKRWFMAAQARRMLDLESRVCREVRHVIAVSEDDAAVFRQQYGCPNVSVIATGVDTDYFHPPQEPVAPVADLIFLGSMNWLPNIDAMEHFLAEIFPLIRRKRPETTLAIVGRQPSPGILALANRTPGVSITGTVPDVRPYLWGSSVSIVPLRIGGGTRLKIYEAVAARLPVVSTTIGAEGLDLHHGQEILLADAPQQFADACLTLLEQPAARERIATQAWNLVQEHYSWDRVTQQFVEILEEHRL